MRPASCLDLGGGGLLLRDFLRDLLRLLHSLLLSSHVAISSSTGFSPAVVDPPLEDLLAAGVPAPVGVEAAVVAACLPLQPRTQKLVR
jgi:hypothetical protein